MTYQFYNWLVRRKWLPVRLRAWALISAVDIELTDPAGDVIAEDAYHWQVVDLKTALHKLAAHLSREDFDGISA